MKKKEDTNMKMDKEWLDFVDTNGKTLTVLLNKIEENINERISICKSINRNLEELDCSKGVYSSYNATYVSQYVNIKMKDGVIACIETYLMKRATKKEFEDYDKLYISLWCRSSKNYDFDYILKTIGQGNAKKRITKGPGAWGKHYILNEVVLSDTFNLEQISAIIKGYVGKINALNE